MCDTVSEFIKKIRLEYSVSTSDIAAFCMLPWLTIRRWENKNVIMPRNWDNHKKTILNFVQMKNDDKLAFSEAMIELKKEWLGMFPR